MTQIWPGYVLDTSAIIGGHRLYPSITFTKLWIRISELFELSRLVCPREVLFELEKRDDECTAWVRSLPGLVVEASKPVISIVGEITNSYPSWVSKNRNWADPWVIAEAEHRNFTVVTQERDKGLSIPRICRERGVEVIDFLGMIRREGWGF